MYVIRQNALKETIQCNIEECTEWIKYLNIQNKRLHREILKNEKEILKYTSKKLNYKELLKTKTNDKK